jgi:phospholipid/cholesterol/gamma-HCH transport system substrate-binding protein
MRRALRSRRRDTEPPLRAAAKGLVVVGVMGAFAWLALTAYNGVPGRSYGTMYAEVPQIGNLIQHDQIRIAGVRVGQVLGTSVAPDGQARLRLQLEPGVALPRDTAIAVRANGLLGARYVQLVPGHASAMLPDGATIRGTKGSLTPGVTDALDALDARTRRGMGDAFGALGQGLLGQGSALNATIRVNAAEQPRFLELIDEILRRPGAAGRMLPSLDSAAAAADRAMPDLARGFSAAAAAFQPLADRQDAVRQTLDAAPPALAAADTGLARGRALLAAARALAVSAGRTLPSAPSGLRRATALLRGSHVALTRTDALLRAAVPAVPAALRLTGALRPVLAPLSQGLDDMRPILQQVGRYGCNIVNLGTVFRSMTGFGGTGEGPGGPAMQFRLQDIPSQEGSGSDTGGPSTITRDGYPAPCKYLATTYPLTVGAPGARRRGATP